MEYDWNFTKENLKKEMKISWILCKQNANYFGKKINLFFDEEDIINVQEDFPIKGISKKKNI